MSHPFIITVSVYAKPQWLCVSMYYILEWMLVGSIPHVNSVCIWLPYFDIAVYYMFIKLFAFVNFQEIKEVHIYLCIVYRTLMSHGLS